MSPIIKRYGVCLLIFISVVLYIFYSHIGHKYIASESAYDNIEIGYTKQGPDDDDDIHVKSEHLVNLRNFQYKTVPVFCTDNQKRKLLGKWTPDIGTAFAIPSEPNETNKDRIVLTL